MVHWRLEPLASWVAVDISANYNTTHLSKYISNICQTFQIYISKFNTTHKYMSDIYQTYQIYISKFNSTHTNLTPHTSHQYESATSDFSWFIIHITLASCDTGAVTISESTTSSSWQFPAKQLLSLRLWHFGMLTRLGMVATIFVSKICNFWQDGGFYGEIMAPWRPGKGSINYIVPLDPKGKSRNLIKNCLADFFLHLVWVCELIPIVKFKMDSISKDSWKL